MIDSTEENKLQMMKDNIYQLLNQLDAMEEKSFRTFTKTADQIRLGLLSFFVILYNL